MSDTMGAAPPNEDDNEEGVTDPIGHLKALQAHHHAARKAGDAKSAKYFKAEIDAHVTRHTADARHMQMMQAAMKARAPAVKVKTVTPLVKD